MDLLLLAIVTATSLVATVLGAWLIRIERESTLKWRLGLVAFTLGAIGTVAGGIAGIRSYLQSEVIENRVGEAEGGVAAAQESVLDVSKRIANRAEMLTPDVLDRLIGRLKGVFDPASLGLVTLGPSQELRDFGDKLESAFREAGILGPGVRLEGTKGKGPILLGGGGEGSGVVVLHAFEKPGPAPIALHDALLEAGIPNVRYEEAPNGLSAPVLAILRLNER